MSHSTSNIWVLTDDRAGNRSQALGVIGALGRPYVEKALDYGPMAGFPNQMLGASLRGLTAASRQSLVPPWPDMVIAAGRRLAPVARHIKQAGGGAPRLVQIMNPGGTLDDFDLVAVPSHDTPAQGENILAVTGAPHGLTSMVLDAARAGWAGRLDALPRPRIAVIVGGATRRRQFTEDMATALGHQASAFAAAQGGSLMVTTSRRTGAAAKALLAALDGECRVHQWAPAQADNPYRGYIAHADAIIVTGESISMCSEACAAGVPVFVFAPPGLISEKHGRFHDILFDGGYAQPLSDPPADLNAVAHRRLNAAEVIAATIENIIDIPLNPQQ